MKNKIHTYVFYILLFLFISIFQSIVFFVFYAPKSPPSYPYLRERIGNTLWKPQEKQSQRNNLYCYYPSSSVQARGEMIIEKVDSINQCKDWYGIVEIPDYFYSSEPEKISNYPLLGS